MSDVLSGKRIMIIEDEFLIAVTAEDSVRAHGGEVVATVGTVADAISRVQAGVADCAVLDLNLAGQRSDPVVEALVSANIPFVVTTGYGSSAWSGDPTLVLDKPYTSEQLVAALSRRLES